MASLWQQLGLADNPFFAAADNVAGTLPLDFNDLVNQLPSSSGGSGVGDDERGALNRATSAGVSGEHSVGQGPFARTSSHFMSLPVSQAGTAATQVGSGMDAGAPPPKRGRESVSGQKQAPTKDKLKDLEALAQRKAAEYQQLLDENQNLKFRHGILEKGAWVGCVAYHA